MRKKAAKYNWEITGGGSGSSLNLRENIFITVKEMKNALITFNSEVIKIEADLIDLGGPKFQEKLKKKYGIDLGTKGGGGGGGDER